MCSSRSYRKIMNASAPVHYRRIPEPCNWDRDSLSPTGSLQIITHFRSRLHLKYRLIRIVSVYISTWIYQSLRNLLTKKKWNQSKHKIKGKGFFERLVKVINDCELYLVLIQFEFLCDFMFSRVLITNIGFHSCCTSKKKVWKRLLQSIFSVLFWNNTWSLDSFLKVTKQHWILFSGDWYMYIISYSSTDISVNWISVNRWYSHTSDVWVKWFLLATQFAHQIHLGLNVDNNP